MISYYNVLIVLLLSTISSFISQKLVKEMIIHAGFTKKNYKGHDIPLSVGIGFIPVIVFSLTPVILNKSYVSITIIYMFVTCAMCFAGLIDDVFGSREASGFKGHIKQLFKFKLTTGGFKAVFGGLCAIVAAIFFDRISFLTLIDILIFALFTNLINLFDLRPGRATKFFWIFCAAFLLMGYHNKYIIIFIPIFICTVMFFKGDIKALYMMGDSGSNVLGCSLGFFSIIVFEKDIKIPLMLLLLFLNLLSEKVSFSKIIENNRILKFIDMIGREKA